MGTHNYLTIMNKFIATFFVLCLSSTCVFGAKTLKELVGDEGLYDDIISRIKTVYAALISPDTTGADLADLVKPYFEFLCDKKVQILSSDSCEMLKTFADG